MLDAQSSAQPEAAKGLLGSGFYFWVLVFVSEDIFGAFLAAAAAAAFFLTGKTSLLKRSLSGHFSPVLLAQLHKRTDAD